MKKGYTLIEMLVVLTIIATLATIGSFGINNVFKSISVKQTLTQLQGMLDLSCIESRARHTYARLLIHAQNSPDNNLHRERYLRYAVIQILNHGPNEKLDTVDPNNPLEDDFWEITSKGYYFAKYSYFIPSLSNQDELEIPTTNVRLPAQPDGETSLCYYYEIRGLGAVSNVLTAPKAEGFSPRLIVAEGSLPPNATEPLRTNKNIGGFLISRNVKTLSIKRVEQIDPNL